jgi:hypothetical protein
MWTRPKLKSIAAIAATVMLFALSGSCVVQSVARADTEPVQAKSKPTSDKPSGVRRSATVKNVTLKSVALTSNQGNNADENNDANSKTPNLVEKFKKNPEKFHLLFMSHFGDGNLGVDMRTVFPARATPGYPRVKVSNERAVAIVQYFADQGTLGKLHRGKPQPLKDSFTMMFIDGSSSYFTFIAPEHEMKRHANALLKILGEGESAKQFDKVFSSKIAATFDLKRLTEGVPFAIAADDAPVPPVNASYRVLIKDARLEDAVRAIGKEMDVKIELPEGELRKERVSLDEKQIGLMNALQRIVAGKYFGSTYSWGDNKFAKGTIINIKYLPKKEK